LAGEVALLLWTLVPENVQERFFLGDEPESRQLQLRFRQQRFRRVKLAAVGSGVLLSAHQV
jgi:hypothetical protein